MQAKLLKVGWIIMLILGMYRLVVSFMLLAMGEDISASVLLGTTGVAIIGLTLGASTGKLRNGLGGLYL